MQDADGDAGEGVSAVSFEVELALEGVVDRLDDLPQWFEEARARRGVLALAGRAQQLDAGVGEGGFEVAAVVVLVRDQRLCGLGGEPGSGRRRGCRAAPRVRRPWRRSARTPPAARAGCTAGAAAAPRSSGSARRSSRTRPSRPAPSVSPSPGSGRTRPGSSRPPRRRRSTALVRAARRPMTARSMPALPAAACCSRTVGAGRETRGADGCARSAASGPRW